MPTPPQVCQRPAGDEGVDEDQLSSPSLGLLPRESLRKEFDELLKQVEGNYLEERLYEREILLNYIKYSEEEIKYKCTPTYAEAPKKFQVEYAKCKKAAEFARKRLSKEPYRHEDADNWT